MSEDHRPQRDGSSSLIAELEERPVSLDRGAFDGEPPSPRAALAANGHLARALPAGGPGEFSSERMLRAEVDGPRGGWRRLVFGLSGGLVHPAPSGRELRERALVGRVKAPISGCRRVAVVSRKGGVGKTTTTLMLGHTFASYRGDRVVALDGNPDAGSLGYRVRRETTNTVMSLLAHRDRISRYADIRAFTSQARTRLEVVAADDDPRITDALCERDFLTAVGLLETHYNLVLLDTGTGVLESASRGILGLADQLVVVAGPSLDSARAASLTLDWLERNGHEGLVAGAVAVINGIRRRSVVELERLEAHFAARCRAVVQVGCDRHLEAGAESDLDRLRPRTRGAYLELAAAVADGFSDVQGDQGGL